MGSNLELGGTTAHKRCEALLIICTIHCGSNLVALQGCLLVSQRYSGNVGCHAQPIQIDILLLGIIQELLEHGDSLLLETYIQSVLEVVLGILELPLVL